MRASMPTTCRSTPAPPGAHDVGGGEQGVDAPGLPLGSDFLDVLTGAYGSPLAEADFASDPEAQRP